MCALEVFLVITHQGMRNFTSSFLATTQAFHSVISLEQFHVVGITGHYLRMSRQYQSGQKRVQATSHANSFGTDCSGNTLCAGDHVSWHCALDSSESRLQHMLMASDSQLSPTSTPFGTVNFVQVVGICREELLVAQRWNGPGVLEILKRLPV